MKINRFILTLATAAILPVQAEWEPRGLCHVWTGGGAPEAPEDMLTGVIYDYNRNPKGEFFTYSGVYSSENTTPRLGKSLKEVQKIRHTGAKNPTNSPDVHGQCAQVLKLLMQGKKAILSKVYKYPYHVAAPHIYMAPTKTSDPVNILKGKKGGDSDFIADTNTQSTKATSHKDHASWIGVFRGTVVAPKSMKFRFCGAADDSIIVNFNNDMVLETGYVHPEIYKGNGIKDPGCDWEPEVILNYQKNLAAGKIPGRKGYEVIALRSTPYTNKRFNGITCGAPITVEEGKAYPIEIIIANNGGTAMHYLLTQELGTGGQAPLQLFRTSDAPVTLPYGTRSTSSEYEAGPSYEEDSPIWKVKGRKSKKEKTKFRKVN
ncbi:MAG: hypothetical protein IKW48_06725 [Akkermansia sp.]|nr:hypothetical protein [Akkermansia sp.]